MAVFASPTVIGPEALLEYTFENKETYVLAKKAELMYVIALQEKLSAQLGYLIEFDKRLIGTKTDNELEEFKDLQLPIGNTDGFIWLQHSMRRWEKEKARKRKNSEQVSVSSFSHLMEHSPVSGVFLPLDFPDSFSCNLRGDTISIGSSIRVQKELHLWLDLILPWHNSKEPKLAKIYEDYAKNFLQVVNFSIVKGVAVEIL